MEAVSSIPFACSPLQDEKPAKTEGNVSHPRPPTHSPPTVLVVEDEFELAEVVELILVKASYRVLTANTGASGFDLWRETSHPIDVILTDVVMPYGCSGFDLARQVWNRNGAQKILFMSGYSLDRLSCPFPLPGDHFLQKPFSPRDLLARLALAMDR